MNNKEAKEYTDKIFYKIESCHTIEDLKGILDTYEDLKKYQKDITTYPKLEFNLTKNEINYLRKQKIINNNYGLNINLSSELKDPLAKLLYAIIWKQGDLKKIKHIVKGIIDTNQVSQNAQVFFQYGKYLSEVSKEPIIDKNVIRAFGIYHNSDENEIYCLRKLNQLKKKHQKLIFAYKNWLNNRLTNELKANDDYLFYIDQVLFATGKAIKIK